MVLVGGDITLGVGLTTVGTIDLGAIFLTTRTTGEIHFSIISTILMAHIMTLGILIGTMEVTIHTTTIMVTSHIMDTIIQVITMATMDHTITAHQIIVAEQFMEKELQMEEMETIPIEAKGLS